MILDIRLPGLMGSICRHNFRKTAACFRYFMTGHGDIPMPVRAMKADAVDFLTEPFRDQDMLDAVGLAVQRSRVQSSGRRSCGCFGACSNADAA